MTNDRPEKSCFVIAPIGDDDSDIRKRSDQVLKHIIKPAAQDCGYKAERADEIDKPGLITGQVITRVVKDDLVIADMTGMNPNVFYELAIRHAAQKPLVQIIQQGERIPFDVAGTRTIFVDHTDLDSAASARSQIAAQIKALEEDPTDIETPISTSLDLQSLRQSDDPEDRNYADLIEEISDIRQLLDQLVDSNDKTALPDVMRALSQIRESVDQPNLFSTRRQKYFERNMFESMAFIRHSSGHGLERAVAFAVIGSFFKELAPWIYESAMEVFRQHISGSETKRRTAEERFREIVETTIESPIMRDLIENDKRSYMAYSMLKEIFMDLR